MIKLKNGNLTAEISEIGAELRSLKKNDCEYIWNADPAVWAHSAPILFPIISSMKDDSYVLDGVTYTMPKHGFVIGKKFNVTHATDTEVTLLYTHDKQTLTHFPFEFELRVIFTLSADELKIEYVVKNLTDKVMYFSVGAHEAYSTPEGIEAYDVVFPFDEDLDTLLLSGRYLSRDTLSVGKSTRTLPLKEKYFKLDTLMFKGLKSRSLTLKSRTGGRNVRIDFPHCDYLAIWHVPNAAYVCIEPWSGLPDYEDGDQDVTHKEGIIKLAARGEYRNAHTITV